MSNETTLNDTDLIREIGKKSGREDIAFLSQENQKILEEKKGLEDEIARLNAELKTKEEGFSSLQKQHEDLEFNYKLYKDLLKRGVINVEPQKVEEPHGGENKKEPEVDFSSLLGEK